MHLFETHRSLLFNELIQCMKQEFKIKIAIKKIAYKKIHFEIMFPRNLFQNNQRRAAPCQIILKLFRFVSSQTDECYFHV